MKIGVDLDNTVAEFSGGFIEWLVNHGRHAEGNTLSHSYYDLVKCGWFDSKEEFKALFNAAEDDGLYGSLSLIENSSTVLRQLAEDNEIIYITARNSKYGSESIEWLEDNGIWFGDILHEPNKQLVTGVDVFVDDADYQIENLLSAGNQVIIANREYNQHITHDVRFDDWLSVPSLIKAL